MPVKFRYGRKLEAVSLLQEWVTNIGSEASPPLNASNTRINSGAIGAPESRLELEITLETLAELEQFWATIPPEAHKHWSQRMNPCLMDGSPTWEVFRTVDVFPESEVGISQDTNIERKEASSYPRIMEITDESDIEKYGQSMDQNPPLGSKTKTTPSGLSVVTDEDDVETILDWKGDPMKIRPGDKLPFKFQ